MCARKTSPSISFYDWKQNKVEKPISWGARFSTSLETNIPFLLGIQEGPAVKEIPEAEAFEQKIEALRKQSTTPCVFSDTRMALPSFHSSFQPRENKQLFLKVHFHKRQILLSVSQENSCDELVAAAIAKLNFKYEAGLEQTAEKFVFKALGFSEYFYGTSRFCDHQFVEKTLRNQTSTIPVILMEGSVALEKCSHPVEAHLSTVDYDMNFEREKYEVYDHSQISFANVSWDNLKVISLWDLDRPFRVKIRSLAHFNLCLPEGLSNAGLYACVELLYGSQPLAPAKFTKIAPAEIVSTWNQFLTFEIMISELPREAVLSCSFFATNQPKEEAVKFVGKRDMPLCFVKHPLFDHKRQLKAGIACLKVRDNRPSPETLAQNCERRNLLCIELDKYHSPVVYPSGTLPEKFNDAFASFEDTQRSTFTQNKLNISRILMLGPPYNLNEEDKALVWKNREMLKASPKVLPIFLNSIPVRFPTARKIASELAASWTKSSDVLNYLQLLDYHYPDPNLRKIAVSALNCLSDSELSDFTLQLVQLAQFEIYHDSALVRFLLQRAVRNTHVNGHALFWALRAEMHVPETRVRNFLILSEYLKTCEKHRAFLAKQVFVVDMIFMLRSKLLWNSLEERANAAREEVNNLVLPAPFALPTDPRVELQGIMANKCKFVEYLTSPKSFVFQNADPGAACYEVSFKACQDLRQEVLALQVIRVMDRIWKKELGDLRLTHYGCVVTSHMHGIVELVPQSCSVESIRQVPLKQYIQQISMDVHSSDSIDNLIRSNAGYSVATYLLGIGDRNAYNLMIKSNGDFFHTDLNKLFHKFKKSKSRPFACVDRLLTADYQQLACKAFTIIRANADLFTNMLLWMIPCGLPEIVNKNDVALFRKAFYLEEADPKAVFQGIITKSKRRKDLDYLFVTQQFPGSVYAFGMRQNTTVYQDASGPIY